MAEAILADVEASGIYQIRNLVNGKVYIGSAKCFRKRWSEHRRDLELGRHHSVFLQRAWLKYGPNKFAFEIVEQCEIGSLISREQAHIDVGSDYNICKVAGSTLGVLATEETRAKLKAAQARIRSAPDWVSPTKGRKYSAEVCERMAAPKRGKKRTPFSAQHRARISASKKGNQSSLGRVLSAVTKNKIRESLIGFKKPISERIKRCSLTDEQVSRILHLRVDGHGQREIGEKFGISQQLVQKICARKRYEWVEPDLKVQPFIKKGWKVVGRKKRASS